MSTDRTHRLWRQAGLQVPRRRPRRRVALSRPRPVPATAVNHVWAYDFVFDTCANGQTLKCLTVVDEQIETALIEPGKPWQNATDESFNGKFRDEYLSLQWFRNRVDAKVGIEQWRRHYNDVRPHSSLGYLTPAEFKAQLRAGSDDGGRSPAMPAHADQEEHEERLNHADWRCSPVIGGPKKAGRSTALALRKQGKTHSSYSQAGRGGSFS